MEETFETNYHKYETAHFWFKARRDFIIQLLNKTPKKSSVLDIGCSSGILLSQLNRNGFQSDNLYGVDISEKAINNCKKNGLNNVFVMDAENIDLKKKFDIIIASDCLEHLKNDTKALENWRNLLSENGKLYIFVPAFKLLWSQHDVVNMHYRRYTRKQLSNELVQNKFTINRSGYWNFFLFFPALTYRITCRLFKKHKTPSGDLKVIPIVNSIFKAVLKTENKLLNFIDFPLGISTFCVAEKND